MRAMNRRSFFAVSAISALALRRKLYADVGQAELAGKRSKVIASCTSHWDENKGDCSAFVRAVAHDLGFELSGQANDIYQQISAVPWVRIGIGTTAAAGVTAGEGKFVVAALTGKPNGHVAVVVDYRNAFDSYASGDREKAVAFWGKLNSVGKEYTRITRSWTADDLKKVLYAYRPIN
jgi:hypothetical protein